MSDPLKVLWVGGAPAGPARLDVALFAHRHLASLDAAAQAVADAAHDALVLQLADGEGIERVLRWSALSHAVLDAAVLVLAREFDRHTARELLRRGVQDMLPTSSADAATLTRALVVAVERKRLEMSARKAYATDLGSGLPNHTQLLEHMTHLLALREREPAPMALLVLRIDGLATTEAALGTEAANVLRRKVAVRLRAGLRASDVVASIGADAFAVLLAWMDAPEAGERVAAKLVQSLQRSFNVAGQERAVAVGFGVSLYPEHGRHADELLRRAIGQAAGMAAVGRAGFAAHVERGPGSAANDEGPDTVL